MIKQDSHLKPGFCRYTMWSLWLNVYSDIFLMALHSLTHPAVRAMNEQSPGRLASFSLVFGYLPGSTHNYNAVTNHSTDLNEATSCLNVTRVLLPLLLCWKLALTCRVKREHGAQGIWDSSEKLVAQECGRDTAAIFIAICWLHIRNILVYHLLSSILICFDAVAFSFLRLDSECLRHCPDTHPHLGCIPSFCRHGCPTPHVVLPTTWWFWWCATKAPDKYRATLWACHLRMLTSLIIEDSTYTLPQTNIAP